MVHKPKTYTHQKRKDSEHNMAVIKSEERKEKGEGGKKEGMKCISFTGKQGKSMNTQCVWLNTQHGCATNVLLCLSQPLSLIQSLPFAS